MQSTTVGEVVLPVDVVTLTPDGGWQVLRTGYQQVSEAVAAIAPPGSEVCLSL